MSDTAAPPPSPQALAELLRQADPARHLAPALALPLAEQALAMAQALHDPRAELRARAWLLVQRFRHGDYARVIAEAPPLQAEAGGESAFELQLEVLRALALSANEQGRFDLAMNAARRMAYCADQIGEPGPRVLAAFILAATLERMGDSWQADRVLEDILADDATAQAPAREQMVAHNARAAMMIGLFHRLRGVSDDQEIRELLQRALRHARRAAELLQGLDDPAYEVAVTGNEGELLVHLGQLDDAQRLLTEAHNRAQHAGLLAHCWRVSTSLADWQIAKGRPDQARTAVRRLLAEMGEQAPQQTAIRARQAAYRACRGMGLFEEALAHFEAAEALERKRTNGQLRAQSQYFVTRIEVEQARHQAQRQLARANQLALQAEQDALTGLGNRHYLQRRLEEVLTHTRAGQLPLTLALLDVDHFKHINDQHGHARGDQVLVQLAHLLRERLRGGDLLARWGGEEFIVVLPDTDQARSLEICERVCEAVRHHHWPEGVPQQVTVSVGVAAGGGEGGCVDAAVLLQRADEALYRAKREGRGRVCAWA